MSTSTPEQIADIGEAVIVSVFFSHGEKHLGHVVDVREGTSCGQTSIFYLCSLVGGPPPRWAHHFNRDGTCWFCDLEIQREADYHA